VVDQERSGHLLSWHQVQTDEAAAAALRPVKAAGSISEDPVRLCVLGDGATWIWNQVNTLFPTAVQIPDDDHCREHVHKVGALPFIADAVQEQEWVEAMRARLFWGSVDWRSRGYRACSPEIASPPRKSAS
jgi:hypothetical protein